MSTDEILSVTEPIEPFESQAEYGPMPRTRWTAIVWGLFFGGLAVAGLMLLGDPTRRDDLIMSVNALSAGSLVAGAVLAVGILVLVAGLAGLIRHAQRRLSY